MTCHKKFRVIGKKSQVGYRVHCHQFGIHKLQTFYVILSDLETPGRQGFLETSAAVSHSNLPNLPKYSKWMFLKFKPCQSSPFNRLLNSCQIKYAAVDSFFPPLPSAFLHGTICLLWRTRNLIHPSHSQERSWSCPCSTHCRNYISSG